MDKRLYAAMLMAAGIIGQAQGANFYVAPTGSDNNTGAKEQPFASLARGQTAAQPGDTVFLRGGTYDFNSSSAEIGLTLSKSGTSGHLIHYFAYPNEIPVFDFKNMTAAKRIKGVLVKADWLHLKGIEMKNIPQTDALKAHEDWCLYIDPGSNNIFEQLNLHHNMGPGMYLQEGSNNLFLNCDSHDNYDPYSYATNSSGGKVLGPGENADGFGVHVNMASSTGNRFYGCRAWWNADDGWDFISCSASVTVENCWAWGNGYRSGTNPPQSAGNGNGFKVGGFGDPPTDVANPTPQHTVRFCLAFDNRSAGFYQNHHPISNFYYNNTSFNNKGSNFNLLGYKGGDASMGILRNNIAFMGTALGGATFGSGVDAANNSWDISGLSVSNTDFESTDSAGVYAQRKPDGSLPDITFMKLKARSKLIDKGVDLKLAYTGTAPDLGAFEYGPSVGIVRKESKPLVRGSRLSTSGGADAELDIVGRIHRAGRSPVLLLQR